MQRLIEAMLTAGLCVLALTATTVHGQTKNPLVGAWKVTEIANPNSPPLTNPQPGLYVFTEKHYSAVRLNGTRPSAVPWAMNTGSPWCFFKNSIASSTCSRWVSRSLGTRPSGGSPEWHSKIPAIVTNSLSSAAYTIRNPEIAAGCY